MALSYILTLGWMAIFAIAMVPVIGYISTDAICEEEIYSQSAQQLQDSNYCFKLDRFGQFQRRISAVFIDFSSNIIIFYNTFVSRCRSMLHFFLNSNLMNLGFKGFMSLNDYFLAFFVVEIGQVEVVVLLFNFSY